MAPYREQSCLVVIGYILGELLYREESFGWGLVWGDHKRETIIVLIFGAPL